MTNTTQKNIDTIKENNPALAIVDYSNHTAHLKKAQPFTCNYAIIDAVVMESYVDHTIREIAIIMNESFWRVAYRVAFLQKNHKGSVIRKYGNIIDKGTYKVSDIGQSKRKANA